MTNNLLEIHEFSTGINYDILADGTWISTGFTGEYMNKTIAAIPLNIERAIANKLFGVAEGKSHQKPALIGRVILGDEFLPAYSVIAIVSRGEDDKSRPLSVYRYLFTEGENSLGKIVAWIERYYQQTGDFPLFNPQIKKKLDEPNYLKIKDPIYCPINEDTQQWLAHSSTPILIKPQQTIDDLQTLNSLASYKAILENQTVAWAYNIEALETPWYFTLIQPNNQQAYGGLKNAIASQPNLSKALVIDEAAVKSAIRNIINSSDIESEAIGIIFNQINNPELTPEYWLKLFDGEGANHGIRQEIYSPSMARLLTLRAMIVPDTILEYLNWLNSKNNHYQQDSWKWQHSLFKNLSTERRNELQLYLMKGLKVLLAKLLNNKLDAKSFSKLLTNSQSIWSHYQKHFVDAIELDLSSLKPSESQLIKAPEWLYFDQEIWEALKSYYLLRKPISYYAGLASLLKRLSVQKVDRETRLCTKKAAQLAAYFEQVTKDKVEEKIFAKAFHIHGTKLTEKYLGLVIKRETSCYERLNFLGSRYFTYIGLLLVLCVSGFVAKKLYPDLVYQATIDKAISQENLEKTIQTLENIKDDETLQARYSELNIDQAIIESICQNQLESYCSEIISVETIPMPNSPQGLKKMFAQAIYSYEESKKLKPDGVLEKLSSELNHLKRDVIQALEARLITIAMDNFEITRHSIQSMIKSKNPKDKYQEGDKLKKIKIILGNAQLNDQVILNNNQSKEVKIAWIQAIYNYQKDILKLSSADGIIAINSPTYEKLEAKLNSNQ